MRVAATSFNPVDAAIRAGYLREAFALRQPHTPGLDVAGTVAALGDGVEGLNVGDDVIGLLSLTDDGAAHQAPAVGVPNFAYALVRNRGTAAATGVTVRAFQSRVAALRSTNAPDPGRHRHDRPSHRMLRPATAR